jgi:hypothetical protein
MTKVTIVQENDPPNAAFRAAARNRQSVGRTPGAALDALTQQLDESETQTMIVLQSLKPDEFFTAAQQQRLQQLLARQRDSREGTGPALSAEERSELESLVDAELDGAAARAAAMVRELNP